MATCQQEIETALASGSAEDIFRVMKSNVLETVTADVNVKDKLTISSAKQEAITCQFNQYGGTPADVVISWFKLEPNETTMKSVGSISTRESTITFQKDLLPGIYFICFAVRSGVCEGTFKAEFTSYPVSARYRGIFSHGSSMAVSELRTAKIKKPCNEAMEFEFVSGHLPPGVTLGADGVIRGTLPSLDCVKDITSPSANWFYYNHDGTAVAIPGRWEFRARVRLVNEPSTYDEEDFAIEVYHNWDSEREMFKDVGKYVEVYKIPVEAEKPALVLPKGICPDPVPIEDPNAAKKYGISSEIDAFLDRLPENIASKLSGASQARKQTSTEKYIEVINTLNSENIELQMAMGAAGEKCLCVVTTQGELWGYAYQTNPYVLAPGFEVTGRDERITAPRVSAPNIGKQFYVEPAMEPIFKVGELMQVALNGRI